MDASQTHMDLLEDAIEEFRKVAVPIYNAYIDKQHAYYERMKNVEPTVEGFGDGYVDGSYEAVKKFPGDKESISNPAIIPIDHGSWDDEKDYSLNRAGREAELQTMFDNMMNSSEDDDAILATKIKDLVAKGSLKSEMGQYSNAILFYFDALKLGMSSAILEMISKNFILLGKEDLGKEFQEKADSMKAVAGEEYVPSLKDVRKPNADYNQWGNRHMQSAEDSDPEGKYIEPNIELYEMMKFAKKRIPNLESFPRNEDEYNKQRLADANSLSFDPLIKSDLLKKDMSHLRYSEKQIQEIAKKSKQGDDSIDWARVYADEEKINSFIDTQVLNMVKYGELLDQFNNFKSLIDDESDKSVKKIMVNDQKLMYDELNTLEAKILNSQEVIDKLDKGSHPLATLGYYHSDNANPVQQYYDGKNLTSPDNVKKDSDPIIDEKTGGIIGLVATLTALVAALRHAIVNQNMGQESKESLAYKYALKSYDGVRLTTQDLAHLYSQGKTGSGRSDNFVHIPANTWAKMNGHDLSELDPFGAGVGEMRPDFEGEYLQSLGFTNEYYPGDLAKLWKANATNDYNPYDDIGEFLQSNMGRKPVGTFEQLSERYDIFNQLKNGSEIDAELLKKWPDIDANSALAGSDAPFVPSSAVDDITNYMWGKIAKLVGPADIPNEIDVNAIPNMTVEDWNIVSPENATMNWALDELRNVKEEVMHMPPEFRALATEMSATAVALGTLATVAFIELAPAVLALTGVALAFLAGSDAIAGTTYYEDFLKDLKSLQEAIIKPNKDFKLELPSWLKKEPVKDDQYYLNHPATPATPIIHTGGPDSIKADEYQEDGVFIGKDGKPIEKSDFYEKPKSKQPQPKKSDIEYDDWSPKEEAFGPPEPPKSDKKKSDDPLSFLDDTNLKLQEKGKAGAEIMAEIKAGYAKEIGTMFDGNDEALARTGKGLMEMMGKIIKKVLTATILEQVLAQVGSMGPYGWLFTPVIYGAIQVGLNAIVDPILKGLILN